MTPAELVEQCRAVREAGGRLVSLWASEPNVLSVALQEGGALRVIELPDAQEYPDLSAIFPVADRLQRAARDLFGVRAIGAVDERPWLRHDGVYPFVRVDGDGVHEIPVGPVHAGIIEPGHFRFSIVGEKVLRLEERLGYVHKGIERRFEGMDLATGAKLAARVSGDSAAAFAWAFCMAAEEGIELPERAAFLRALLLERERIANHLGDLGALGNDAGFAFGLSQFSRLKELHVRANAAAFGARYPFDAIVPGGVAHDLAREHVAPMLAQLDALAVEVAELREIFDNHAGVQDRFAGAGILEPALAARLGVVGLAGRASAQPWDLRCDAPVAPYDRFVVKRVVREAGDVAARVAVRFDEVFESIDLCRALLSALPAGTHRIELEPRGGTAYGWIEGWRGPAFVALTLDSDARIARCHPHDPSWQNWPALEHAVIGNIVPDFPLINKSFNLSYAGHDL